MEDDAAEEEEYHHPNPITRMAGDIFTVVRKLTHFFPSFTSTSQFPDARTAVASFGVARSVCDNPLHRPFARFGQARPD